MGQSMLFERVAILGVGLIGGSFALALKQAKACAHVAGAGRNEANLKLALERGVIDSIAADAVAAAHGADLVLLAAPVAQFPKLLRELASVLGPKAIVTDAGSTKRDVVQAARAALGKRISQFVPAHPIAGAEKSGAGAANAELFRDKRVILTPLSENSDSTIRSSSSRARSSLRPTASCCRTPEPKAAAPATGNESTNCCIRTSHYLPLRIPR